MSPLRCEPLTPASFAPFGAVLAPSGEGVPVNDGRGRRHALDGVLPAPALPGGAVLQTALYEIAASALPFDAWALERHPLTRQLFCPLDRAPYLVVVCLPGPAGEPDLSTVRAFRVAAPTGVVYAPGVWHVPMVALERPGTFLMQMWGGAGAADCVVHPLGEPLRIAP